MNKSIFRILSILILCSVPLEISAQLSHRSGVERPNVSQGASVNQQVGITDIEIEYHGPRANGRVIWGGLVPFGQVWRAGANQNTTISFSTSVTIEGEHLDAGTYGLHMLPEEDDNFTVIFSSNHTSWGSFYYEESEDALRVKATVSPVDHREALMYYFEPLNQSQTQVHLDWAGKKITFNVSVPMIETTIANFRNKNLRHLPRFEWYGRWEAAMFCMAHETNLDEALEWINVSIQQEEKFENLMVKSDILKLLGREQESKDFLNKALEKATSYKLGVYGAELLGIFDKPLKALEVFKLHAEQYPNEVPPYTRMARVYFRLGETTMVEQSMERAMQNADSEQEKRSVRFWARVLDIEL